MNDIQSDIVLDRRDVHNTDYNIAGDFVQCMNCGKLMLLDIGTDVCPECNEDGTLSWADEKHQEIIPSELIELGYLLNDYTD